MPKTESAKKIGCRLKIMLPHYIYIFKLRFIIIYLFVFLQVCQLCGHVPMVARVPRVADPWARQ